MWGVYDSNSTNSVVTERGVEAVVSKSGAPIGCYIAHVTACDERKGQMRIWQLNASVSAIVYTVECVHFCPLTRERNR